MVKQKDLSNYFSGFIKGNCSMRPSDKLRPIEIVRGYLSGSPGSVLYRSGDTVVLCTASIQEGVPPWMAGRGKGWVTAEYNMLPHSTSPRKSRERDGKTDGRTTEIQRLIGRSMRAVVDLAALGEKSVTVDCDVLQADGGTRTAAITGGFIALADAIASAFPNCIPPGISSGLADGSSAVPVSGNWGGPIKDSIAAVSVGVVDGINYLDLDYRLDSQADVDMNVVMTGRGHFVEIQGSGEEATFDHDQLQDLLRLASDGIRELTRRQRQSLAR
jgi:ribonuclease PH